MKVFGHFFHSLLFSSPPSPLGQSFSRGYLCLRTKVEKQPNVQFPSTCKSKRESFFCRFFLCPAQGSVICGSWAESSLPHSLVQLAKKCFYIFGWGKNQKMNILWYLNNLWMSCPWIKVYWNPAKFTHFSHLHLLSQHSYRQSWVVVTDPVQLTKSEVWTFWTLTEKVNQLDCLPPEEGVVASRPFIPLMSQHRALQVTSAIHNNGTTFGFK